MTDQPQSDRFKAEMPQIPGVSVTGAGSKSAGVTPAIRLVAGLVGVLFLFFLGSRVLGRKHHDAPAQQVQPAQMEVPAPPPDPAAAYPHASPTDPQVATVAEMSKPWTSKNFFFVNRITGENVPALLIRLPGASPNVSEGYWAMSMSAPYGNCQLEYVTDMDKLKNDYDFHAAKHPMVGNPCSRTLFDPLKMTSVPPNIWVRGAIVQGSDLRPPLGIEVKIEDKSIQAVRME
jgi:hypothetical protein